MLICAHFLLHHRYCEWASSSLIANDLPAWSDGRMNLGRADFIVNFVHYTASSVDVHVDIGILGVALLRSRQWHAIFPLYFDMKENAGYCIARHSNHSVTARVQIL